MAKDAATEDVIAEVPIEDAIAEEATTEELAATTSFPHSSSGISTNGAAKAEAAQPARRKEVEKSMSPMDDSKIRECEKSGERDQTDNGKWVDLLKKSRANLDPRY